MRVVCYWARAEGAHPNASIELSEQCWLKMHARVKALGYELTLLTDHNEKTTLPHDARYDFSLDPKLCILSREQAFSQYLESVEDREQVAMIEPDTYLRHRIPEIEEGFDLVLFRRDRTPTPTCFRLTRGSGRAYYRELARRTAAHPPEKHRWWGDIEAQESMLGKPNRGGDGLLNLPVSMLGCRIEHRDSRDYCMPPWKSHKDPVAWTFNGLKKRDMLKLP